MGSRKAQFFVMLFGRNGARVVYILLGLSIIVLGALIEVGIIQDRR